MTEVNDQVLFLTWVYIWFVFAFCALFTVKNVSPDYQWGALSVSSLSFMHWPYHPGKHSSHGTWQQKMIRRGFKAFSILSHGISYPSRDSVSFQEKIILNSRSEDVQENAPWATVLLMLLPGPSELKIFLKVIISHWYFQFNLLAAIPCFSYIRYGFTNL